MGLTPRVLPSNARTFPAPAGARFVHANPPTLFPPLPPLPSAGCEPEIEIFFGSFFLVFLLDNASNMCPDSLYVVLETSPRFSPDVPGVRPLSIQYRSAAPRAASATRAPAAGLVGSGVSAVSSSKYEETAAAASDASESGELCARASLKAPRAARRLC